MAIITIVLKNEETKKTNVVRHVHTYCPNITPRVGEYVEISGHPPYEVDRIIHKPEIDKDIVVVEVKEII